MKRSFSRASAICTLLCGLLVAAVPVFATDAEHTNLARYRDAQLEAGAKTLPLLARLAHHDATQLAKAGDLEGAQSRLEQAVGHDPQYVGGHIALAGVRARRFDPEAAVSLFQAVVAIGRSFHTQSLLVLNLVMAIPYVLVLVSLIVCFAFAIKYLPFASHRVKELLQGKFRAALPGPTAYLIVLLPLVLLPGAITVLAYITIVCWLFMHGRERFLMIVLILPFAALGLFASQLRPLTPLSDPKSLTSLASEANDAPGDSRLATKIGRAEASGLAAEKSMALGLLNLRAGEYSTAADHFYNSIALQPEELAGYINLGNVYFLQGSYDKALEGYRKAELIDPQDAVCQHALAQAYIKTLLMREASKALQASAALGLDKVKAEYTPAALQHIAVFPKTFSNKELWRMAVVEGRTGNADLLDEMLLPFTRFSRSTSAWILLFALAFALLLAKTIDPSKLTFQCSNCGQLTCEKCCNTDRDTFLCQECAHTVDGVTSEKVTDALLRQKRQTVVVARRKSSRFVTLLLPGMRDISYGRVSRGFWLAVLFSIGLVQVAARGLPIPDTRSLPVAPSLWSWVLPLVLIVLTYALSMTSKPQYSFRAYRRSRARRDKSGVAHEVNRTEHVA